MRTTEQKELAAAVLKQITEHPESHDQTVWFRGGGRVEVYVWQVRREDLCGSVGCVAGWAVVLHDKDLLDVTSPDARQPIRARATTLLGLNEEESDWLFDVDRSQAQVRRGLQELVNDEEMTCSEYEEDDQ